MTTPAQDVNLPNRFELVTATAPAAPINLRDGCRGLFFGAAGQVAFVTTNEGNDASTTSGMVEFTSQGFPAQAGLILPGRFLRVIPNTAGGSSAGNIWAIY